jgi:hypothetical protein
VLDKTAATAVRSMAEGACTSTLGLRAGLAVIGSPRRGGLVMAPCGCSAPAPSVWRDDEFKYALSPAN